MEEYIIKIYKDKEIELEVKFDLINETVWLTSEQISKLFEKARTTMNEHISNYLLINETICRKFRQVASNGKTYNIKHYPLDLILKIGYKISVDKTNKFNNWIKETFNELKEKSHQKRLPIEFFEDGDFKLEVSVSPKEETVWLTQKQIAKLYDCSHNNISIHLKNILSNEIQSNSVVKEFLTTASDGKNYIIKYYNLDVILSVGYHINSKRGILFRKWVTTILKQYLLKGYSIDESRVILYKENYIELNNIVIRLENKVCNHESRINNLEIKEKDKEIKEKIFYEG